MSNAPLSALGDLPGRWPGTVPVLPRETAVNVLLDRLHLEHQALVLGVRSAGLGGGRRCRRWQGLVVLVDGGSGAGKTHLCQELLAGLRRSGAPLHQPLSLDELVPGWEGLEEGVGTAATVLRALDAGTTARARTWDWERMQPGPLLEVPPLAGGVLLLEGCGALACATQPLPRLRVLRIWVELDRRSRLERVRRRDGYTWDTQAWEDQQAQVGRAWDGADPRWWPSLVVQGAPGTPAASSG